MKAVTNIVPVVFLMGATLEGRVWKEAGSDRTIERTGYKEGGADAYVEHLKGLIKNH
ncbi:MAG: hypothetical protein KDN22_27880 [Verrucomicrobiae bacterium]|nr:hypothetical protein [Verrucomicrobiae bacterium]